MEILPKEKESIWWKQWKYVEKILTTQWKNSAQKSQYNSFEGITFVKYKAQRNKMLKNNTVVIPRRKIQKYVMEHIQRDGNM